MHVDRTTCLLKMIRSLKNYFVNDKSCHDLLSRRAIIKTCLENYSWNNLFYFQLLHLSFIMLICFTTWSTTALTNSKHIIKTQCKKLRNIRKKFGKYLNAQNNCASQNNEVVHVLHTCFLLSQVIDYILPSSKSKRIFPEY